MSKLITNWRSRAEQRSRYRQILRELQSMTDAEASDIGLNRVDFHRTARETVYGH